MACRKAFHFLFWCLVSVKIDCGGGEHFPIFLWLEKISTKTRYESRVKVKVSIHKLKHDSNAAHSILFFLSGL